MQFDPHTVEALVAAGAGHYHEVVDAVSEFDPVARRAAVPAPGRPLPGEGIR